MLLCLIGVVVLGQDPMQTPQNKKTVPEFTGMKTAFIEEADQGIHPIKKYLCENVIYPKDALKSRKQGTELLKFTVTKEGNITDIQFINSICPTIDKEIVRVLKKTDGMWMPAVKDGLPVDMEQEIDMVFCANGTSDPVRIHSYFKSRAISHYKSGASHLYVKNNPKKALNHFNKAVCYLPNDGCLLLMRGMAYFELGKLAEAEKDWTRMSRRGDFTIEDLGYDITQKVAYKAAMKYLGD